MKRNTQGLRFSGAFKITKRYKRRSLTVQHCWRQYASFSREHHTSGQLWPLHWAVVEVAALGALDAFHTVCAPVLLGDAVRIGLCRIQALGASSDSRLHHCHSTCEGGFRYGRGPERGREYKRNISSTTSQNDALFIPIPQTWSWVVSPLAVASKYFLPFPDWDRLLMVAVAAI